MNAYNWDDRLGRNGGCSIFELKLLAFESFGVRSMATFVSVDEANIFIDPSASLAPRRYGLPPHEIEIRRLYEVANDIEKFARDSDIIIITHYHYDHHDPGNLIDIDVFRGKHVFIKDPLNNINVSQRIRAAKFLKLLRDRVGKLSIADAGEFIKGKLTIRFSEPIPHSIDSKLGYVVSVSIRCPDSSLVHTSDVEGPASYQAVEFMEVTSPKIIIVDGPPTYLTGYRYDENQMIKVLENLKVVLTRIRPEYLVIDHHLLRDINYTSFISRLACTSSAGTKVLTAAEFSGRSVMLLEALRKKLYEEFRTNGG